MFLIVFFNLYDYSYLARRFEDKNFFLEKRLLKHRIMRNFFATMTRPAKIGMKNFTLVYDVFNQNFKEEVFFILYVFYRRYYWKKFNYYRNSAHGFHMPSYDMFNLAYFLYCVNNGFVTKSLIFFKDISRFGKLYRFFRVERDVIPFKLSLSYKNITGKVSSVYKKIENSRIQYSKAYKVKVFSFLSRANYDVFSRNNNSNLYVDISKAWLLDLKKIFSIRYSNTSVTKNVEVRNQDNYLFYFLRKNKIFNKGRFSRNRQLYRTGVYWSLWVNILAVYGLFFIFYRFSFNFGYLWWFFGFFFLSFIFSRAVQHKFYSIKIISKEIALFINWISLFIFNLKENLINYIPFVFNYLTNMNSLLNFLEKQDFFWFVWLKDLKLKIDDFLLVKEIETFIDFELKNDGTAYLY